MQSMQAWVEANPVLTGIAAFAIILAFLMTFIGALMRRAGTSLRPIVFFLGFVAIVGGPQAVYHIANTKSPDTAAASSSAVNSDVFAIENDRFANPAKVFGEDVDISLVQPAKQIFPEFLANSIHAEMAFFVTNETVLAAIFPDDASARRALQSYTQMLQVSDLSGSDSAGWVGSRGSANDRVRLIVSGPLFMVWTAQHDEVLAKRGLALKYALGVTISVVAPPPAIDNVPFGSLRLALLFLAANVLVAVLWFFKGATWAASSTPAQGTTPISVNDLREKLLTVNQTDTPVTVDVSEDGNTIDVTWRYADARWIDHASAHGLRRVHKISMTLDESSHTARVLEYWSAMDWSAGGKGANIQWHAARGINFFNFQHQRVFGLQISPNGALIPNLSYVYTFNLQELKQPFIQAITHSGWTWKPVFFLAPPWLRWLAG
ncbi:MAG: hypothetical protein IT366_05800 [Candidatus Hydrogenedentes bacterium]|nr:hypothetical protein [Candidatus Hydrogenedentota bacterium]